MYSEKRRAPPPVELTRRNRLRDAERERQHYDSREEKFYPLNEYQQFNRSSSEPLQRRILYTDQPSRHKSIFPLFRRRDSRSDRRERDAGYRGGYVFSPTHGRIIRDGRDGLELRQHHQSRRIRQNYQHTHPLSPQQRYRSCRESTSPVLRVIRESKDFPVHMEPRFSNDDRYREDRYTMECNDPPSLLYNQIKQVNHIYPPSIDITATANGQNLEQNYRGEFDTRPVADGGILKQGNRTPYPRRDYSKVTLMEPILELEELHLERRRRELMEGGLMLGENAGPSGYYTQSKIM